MYICNLDTTIFLELNIISCGFLLRDHEEILMAAKMTRPTGPSDAFAVETLGCKEALSWLKTNKYPQVLVVESNSLLMVLTITKAIPYNTSMGNVLQDCMHILRSIPKSSFAFVKRSVNRVAHLLARTSRSKLGDRGLVFYPSSFLDNVLNSYHYHISTFMQRLVNLCNRFLIAAVLQWFKTVARKIKNIN